jgi:hypothetical protein
MHPSMYYSQYASQIAPPAYASPPATPWWVWFVGGAIAVALGIGAAVWYAGRTEPVQIVQQQPMQQPVITQAVEPPPEKPTQLEVKFDSLPSGGVYADGRSAELCRTPCTFNIDPSDGGALDRRTYVVRSDGYKDMSVVVDLASAKREFKVTLEQLDRDREGSEPEPIADKPTKPGRERCPGRGKTKKSRSGQGHRRQAARRRDACREASREAQDRSRSADRSHRRTADQEAEAAEEHDRSDRPRGPLQTEAMNRLLLAVFLSTFVGGLPGGTFVQVAHANDPTERAARRHYERGQKLFALQKFDEALDQFQKAFDAKPIPDFLFNIGQCQRNLGDYEAAIFSFKKFLKLDLKSQRTIE